MVILKKLTIHGDPYSTPYAYDHAVINHPEHPRAWATLMGIFTFFSRSPAIVVEVMVVIRAIGGVALHVPQVVSCLLYVPCRVRQAGPPGSISLILQPIYWGPDCTIGSARAFPPHAQLDCPSTVSSKSSWTAVRFCSWSASGTEHGFRDDGQCRNRTL